MNDGKEVGMGSSLRGRVALVTGASRGIGAATAKLLASNGAAVLVNYHQSADAAAAVVRAIEAAGGRALALRADARDAADVAAMVEHGQAELGPVDTLVLNASISFPIKPLLDFSWGDFEAKLVGEIAAAFCCVQAVAPSMVERGRGCIVGVSSRISRQSIMGFSVHSTAKSALDGLMRSLAVELGRHGIRVNTVAPGLVLTDATKFLSDQQRASSAAATPLGRVANPEDVAGAILALVRDDSAFVSGAYLPVSGGAQLI